MRKIKIDLFEFKWKYKWNEDFVDTSVINEILNLQNITFKRVSGRDKTTYHKRNELLNNTVRQPLHVISIKDETTTLK